MKQAVIVVITLVIFFAGYYVSYAISGPNFSLAGLSTAQFVDEVTVTQISIQSDSKVKVSVMSKSSTQAGVQYNVDFFTDGVLVSNLTLTWASNEIPNVTKTVTFTGLSLASATNYSIEVRR